MKTVMKFFSLLLCFELILSPVQGSLFIPSNAYADDCPTGQTFNSSVNRCLTSYEVLKVNEATKSCGGNQDCFKENAEKALSDKGDEKNDKWFKEDGKQKGAVTAMNWATVAIPTLIAVKVITRSAKKKKENKGYKCNPPSLLLMYGGAAALAVGEIYGHYNHKSRMKKIEESWRKTVVKKSENSDDQKAHATEAQSQAFEFLAQNEDQVAKTAKTKKGFYLAATGLFAAGAVAATVEQIQLGIARGQLANPQTALAAQQKINKLTCFTQIEKDSNGDGKIDDKDTNIAKETNSANKTKKEIDEKEALEAKNASTNNTNNSSNSSTNTETYTTKTTRPDGTIVEETHTTTTTNPSSSQNNSEGNTNSNPSEKKCLKSCIGDDQHPPHCEQWSSEYKPNDTNERIKRVAAYNISTAKDTLQLLELMKEFDAIEFENYSKISYLSEDEKSIPNASLPAEIGSYIASALIPQAHAQTDAPLPGTTGCDAPVYDPGSEAAAEPPTKEEKNADLMGKASMALPLVLGLGAIVKGVKFKDGGKQVAPGEVDEIEKNVGDKIDKFIGKPVTRIAINGLLGTWMGFASSHMHKQQKISTERAEKLRKMKEEFSSANGIMSCTSADRENSCKAKCFCFTADNKVNTARSKNPVCASEFVKVAYDPFGNDADDKVCLDQNSVVDPSCACRAKKSCMKISSGINMKGFSPGTFRMISTGAGPAQDLFNGNVGGGNIADSAGINAARMRKAAEDMLAKADPKAAKESKSFADGLGKSLIASAGGLSMGGSSNSPLPSSPAAAAAALDKELKESKEADITTAGGGFKSAAGFDSTDEVPEFGMNLDQATSQELEIAEVMGQNLDMGNSDINTGSKTNLFEVLSNRYKRSGMRRLFDEKSKAPVDAPSKKEIVE